MDQCFQETLLTVIDKDMDKNRKGTLFIREIGKITRKMELDWS